MMKINRFEGPISKVLLVISVFSLQSCVSLARYEKEVKETKMTLSQLREAEKKSRHLSLENRNLRARLYGLNRRVGLKNRELNEQVASFTSSQKQIRTELKAASENLGLQISVLQNELAGKQDSLSGLEEQVKTAEIHSNTLEEQLKSSEQETAENKKQLETLVARSQSLEQSLAEATQIANRRESELRESVLAREALIASLEDEITQGHITISQMKNRLSLKIVDKILFDSGSVDISDAGLLLLQKISVTLASLKENNIRIEGHTDDIPIQGRLAARYASNWELSTARATRVVRHFIAQKVSPERLLAIGLSKYKPIASNRTEAGRQQNRRIEIVLAPR